MTITNPQHVSIDGAGESIITRIQSIDILRGLNMAVMIFVNELAGVHNLPWWTYHAKTQWDVMTYVDMVFPGFLFIVGMSLPIAIAARLRKNPSHLSLWGHVIERSVSLWILGLILANGSKAAPALMHGLSRRWWELLGVLGCSLFLFVYPSTGKRAGLVRALRVVGVIMVLAMYAIFRRVTRAGEVAWIDFSYPEILGLIGYAYFAICLLYIPFRKWIWAPAAWLAALVAFNAASTPKGMGFLFAHALPLEKAIWMTRHLPGWGWSRGWEWPWENGSSASMVMAGIVLSIIYLETKWSLRRKTCAAFGYAAATGIVGYVLAPLGISKNRGTPTWCLWTMAACIVCFVLLYWLCDVKKKTAWAAPVRSAGANTLTTYLLPDYWGMVLGVLGIRFFSMPFFHGRWTGVTWAFVFTGLMLAISTLLTKKKVRLAL
jgi:heparan-alpha-glucosaminide N-acetyltransferase